uniref:Ovule protein n=1 Tax=Ascaris lumbricoides TaxID=6252 RepID=A0A0M3HKM4_ASCLU
LQHLSIVHHNFHYLSISSLSNRIVLKYREKRKRLEFLCIDSTKSRKWVVNSNLKPTSRFLFPALYKTFLWELCGINSTFNL